MEFDDIQAALRDFDKLIPDAVAQALSDENPANFLKWLREKLPEYAEPGFWEQAQPGVLDAFAVQCQHLIWNSLPLPGNNFLPRPLPQPGRNDPCPCGSGLKYKQCCASLPKLSPIDPLDLWPFVLGQLPKQKLDEALARNRLPLEGVMAAAMSHLDDEDYEKAVDLLEPLFDGSLKKPRPGLEVALELLCDALDQLGERGVKLDLLKRITSEAPASILRSEAWQRLCAIHLDRDETQTARLAFERAMHDSPEDPFLSFLEIQLLGKEQRWELARERSRFWLKRLQRGGYDPEEVEQITDFLEEAVNDPVRAMENLQRKAEELDPESDRLLTWMEAAARRPLPVYRGVAEPVSDQKDEKAQLTEHFRSMGLPAQEIAKALKEFKKKKPTAPAEPEPVPEGPGMPEDDDSLVLEAPQGMAILEKEWRRVCDLGKPFGTADHPMGEWEGWEPEAAQRWLAFLEQHPEAGDSLDVIDDLATAFLLRPGKPSASLMSSGLLPLLRRARATVEQAVAGIEAPLLKWNRPVNRPALRSLIRLYHISDEMLDDDEETRRLLGWFLALNPDDNHGLRILAMNDLLRQDRNEEAVQLGERYPHDLMAELPYGLALAHYRLDRLRSAQEVAEQAVADLPLVARYLVRDRVRQPKLSPLGITPRGEDQAWLYREQMREEWQRSVGALPWLEKIMKIVGVRR